jgi:hypothetical protein
MSDQRQMNQSELFALLGQLKNKKVEYPDDLLEARRAGFVAQITAMGSTLQSGHGEGGSGSSSGSGGSGGTGGTGGTSIPGAPVHAFETALQYVLAGVVTVMAGTIAYVYQDEIRELINPPAPTVEVIDYESPTSTPLSTDTGVPSPSSTPTFVITPTPQPDEDNPPAATRVVPTSTPEPVNTHPGLHKGQTKTPKPKPSNPSK